jgi:hypothetical protein
VLIINPRRGSNTQYSKVGLKVKIMTVYFKDFQQQFPQYWKEQWCYSLFYWVPLHFLTNSPST